MSAKEYKLPIAEHFHSIQGEGFYTGTPMHFIRLAGCPVGKKATDKFIAIREENDAPYSIPPGQSCCETYDNRLFTCDTDFRVKEWMSAEELIDNTYEKHICLTGGEPLVHQGMLEVTGLIKLSRQKKIDIHIETSGTILVDWAIFSSMHTWLTVSPKAGWLPHMIYSASEIKLLVDKQFKMSAVEPILREAGSDPIIYLSPINDGNTINQENLQACLALLAVNPTWKLSCQWHKFLNLR